ncbi:MAG: hypothetical protein JW863_03235 [Chitinispirillaceae bacterium]|nr:hypothetical protein [Chitinispirillaceae bacterium]
MKYEVLMLPEAEGDPVAIYRYVAEHDSVGPSMTLSGKPKSCLPCWNRNALP